MKRILIILVIVFTWYGCEKKDDDNNLPSPNSAPNPTPAWSFSGAVDGNVLNADSAKAYLHIDSSLGTPIRVLIVMGYCSNNRSIVPGFGDFINSTSLTTLNYDSLGAGAYLDYIDLNNAVDDFFATEAKFKITSVDNVNKKISGSFNGVVVGDVSGDTVVVTNGIFTNILYEVW